LAAAVDPVVAELLRIVDQLAVLEGRPGVLAELAESSA
jgi:hypothetical protein